MKITKKKLYIYILLVLLTVCILRTNYCHRVEIDKLKNENKELSEKLQIMYNKNENLNIDNKRGGFFKRMFSKNHKK